MVTALLFVAAVGCLTSLTAAQQAGCSSFPTNTQVATLISQNYLGNGQGLAPTIILETSPFGYRVVCLSSSGFRNQYRFVSIVAYYTTSDAAVSPPGVPIYGQFEFECVNSAWSATSTLLENPTTDRTTLSAGSAAITANITTNCAYCLKQSVSSPERVSDDTNHCSACIGCSQPLCYTPDTAIPNSGTIRQTCCNFYLSDGVTCTPACNQSYFPDANRTCTQCSLNCQNGGTQRSDMCGCSCTAVSTGSNCSTCLCQNGGTCNGNTCTCPPGYSGQLCNTCIRTCPTGYYLNSSNCSCGQCPANCLSCSDSSTCTTCNTSFTLNSLKLCDAVPVPSPSLSITSTASTATASFPNAETNSCAAVAGISSAVCSIVSFSLGVLVAVLLLFGCYIPRTHGKAKHMQPIGDTVAHQDTTMMQTIHLETNEAYGTYSHPNN